MGARLALDWLRADTKERNRLRRFSLEWSCGPWPLDNLDRLVAAMMKKQVNFSDIVQVAVASHTRTSAKAPGAPGLCSDRAGRPSSAGCAIETPLWRRSSSKDERLERAL